MWYYEFNQQPAGPVDEGTIAELLRNGTINALTLVWRDGMADWKHLGETELSSLTRAAAAPSMPASPASAFTSSYTSAPTPSYSAVTPAGYTRSAGKTPRVKPGTIKKLFIWWSILSIFVALYDVVSFSASQNAVASALACVGSIAALGFAVITYVLLYLFWKVNQDGHASTTPGKAVGFMFIPIFQIYWFFRAYAGLAQDQNRYISEHFSDLPEGTVKKANPVIAFGYLIFTFIGGFVMGILMVAKMRTLMATSLDAMNQSTILASVATPMIIFSLITMVLNFFMFFNFYQTAMSITETEEEQNK